jgi:hypothetical protein
MILRSLTILKPLRTDKDEPLEEVPLSGMTAFNIISTVLIMTITASNKFI